MPNPARKLSVIFAMIIDAVDSRLWRWAGQVTREADCALGYSARTSFVVSPGRMAWDGVPEAYLEAEETERSVTSLPVPLREAVVVRYLGEPAPIKRSTLYSRVSRAHKRLADLWGIE